MLRGEPSQIHICAPSWRSLASTKKQRTPRKQFRTSSQTLIYLTPAPGTTGSSKP